MKLIVNGSERDISSATLADALEELGFGAEVVVATALNGEFVATTARGDAMLADGDRVEILAPMQGG